LRESRVDRKRGTSTAGRASAYGSSSRGPGPILRTGVPGVRRSRLFRAEDNSKAVMVSVFDTPEDFRKFSESEQFAAHRTKIQTYLERAEPGRYELVYEAGDL
jgi:heme-degrading monooxygenase HmoA